MIVEKYFRCLYFRRTSGPAKGCIVLASGHGHDDSLWREIPESEVPKIQRPKNTTIIEYSYEE